MVRNYERTSTQQSWSSTSMEEAIKAVKNGQMGYLKASKTFNVPKATLIRRCKDKYKRLSVNEKGLGRYSPVFNKEQEAELVKYILDMEARLFGVTLFELRSLAFQLAERNAISHPFDKNKKLAGEDWAYGFRKRHREISLRKPESTSAARAQAFNSQNVKQFFDLFKSIMDSTEIKASRIFNCDETGLGTVPKSNSKILAKKGRKQVGRLTSADRSGTTTAVICMSSSGIYVPPMVIFARKRMKVELQDGAPPGTVFACNESGWMNIETFTKWFEHFLKHSKPSVEDPLLLIIDGHASHTKNIDIIDMARKNHVHILCLPPHCTHKMQPIDIGFMGPLERYYDTGLERWLYNHPGRVVTVFQLSAIFGEAYLKAATPLNAINAFKKCGIVPYNPDIFTDLDFAPSLVTEQDFENSQKQDKEQVNSQSNCSTNLTSTPSTSVTSAMPLSSSISDPSSSSLAHVSSSAPVHISSTSSSALTSTSTSSACTFGHIPSSSKFFLPPTPTSNHNAEASMLSCQSFCVSPQDIRPLPRSDKRVKRENRKKGKTAILTASPYKKELESELKEKEDKEARKRERARKRLAMDEVPKKKTKTLRKKKDAIIEPVYSGLKETSQEENDCECFYCNELYSNSAAEEGWVRCASCLQWAHEACAGIEPDDADEFICEICKDVG